MSAHGPFSANRTLARHAPTCTHTHTYVHVRTHSLSRFTECTSSGGAPGPSFFFPSAPVHVHVTDDLIVTVRSTPQGAELPASHIQPATQSARDRRCDDGLVPARRAAVFEPVFLVGKIHLPAGCRGASGEFDEQVAEGYALHPPQRFDGPGGYAWQRWTGARPPIDIGGSTAPSHHLGDRQPVWGMI